MHVSNSIMAPRRATTMNPEQWKNAYVKGDIARPDKLEQWRSGDDGWITPNPAQYLKHVKMLSNSWPHLKFLSDFMEVGTTPLRWNKDTPGGYPDEEKDRAVQRAARVERTNVCQLEYKHDGSPAEAEEYKTSAGLQEALRGLTENASVRLRLFVVEDLSRSVIEALGSHFDVDPAFFREQVNDYAWYNIRDWWRDPPSLDAVSRQQNWFQTRYVRARHFANEKDYQDGVRQAQQFNVFRRLDNDHNHNAFWDKVQGDETGEARVGTMRSRAAFWIKKAEKTDGITYAILLLDPTIKAGHPLWRQYRNWAETPSMDDTAAPAPGPKQASFFEDFIYWAKRPDAFRFAQHSPSAAQTAPTRPSPLDVPTQALLHLVCTEWLNLSDYIKTRLNQVDWEIAFPEEFLPKNGQIDTALKKLHHWRRVVPLYREMLAETLLRVFREAPAGPGTPPPPPGPGHATGGGGASVGAYRQDFALALGYMEEYQHRIDRLTGVVTAVINIDDSRRGYSDNKNLQRLTWLATFFIPLSFIATMLSMQPDVTVLAQTVGIWAQAAIPSGVVTVALVWILSKPAVEAFWRKFPWAGAYRPFKEVSRP